MAVIEVTKENFKEQVLESEKPVLVDFWAPWCGPCMMQGPVIDEVAEEQDQIIFAKVNVDDNIDLARQYTVVSIPTLAYFENGQRIWQKAGATDKNELEGLLGVNK